MEKFSVSTPLPYVDSGMWKSSPCEIILVMLEIFLAIFQCCAIFVVSFV